MVRLVSGSYPTTHAIEDHDIRFANRRSGLGV